jgi:hypothetical protein
MGMGKHEQKKTLKSWPKRSNVASNGKFLLTTSSKDQFATRKG